MYTLWIVETFVILTTLSSYSSSEGNNESQIINETMADIFNIDSITTPRTVLEFWSRNPAFEVKTRAPLDSYRRKIKKSLLYGGPNQHRLKKSESRRAAMQYRRMDKVVNITNGNKNGTHNATVLPPKILRKESAAPKPIKLRAAPGTTNKPIGRKGPRARAEEEEKKAEKGGDRDAGNVTSRGAKDLTPLSPYSILQQYNEILLPSLETAGANITLEVLGRTMEYNDIVMIRASASASAENKFRAMDDEKFDEYEPEKKIVLIVHGLAVMGFSRLPCLKTFEGLTRLIKFYYKHLDKFDIFLIPMANPDGVAASISKAYWNKNMSPQTSCPGVALDRNFDVAWNTSLTEISSCNQHYPGREPFSETETQAVRDIFHKYSHRIIGYFNVHANSYSADVFKGDGVLYPKGYTDVSQDDDRYIDIKGEIDECVKNASFKYYSVGMETLNSWYGFVYGTSVDFAATVYGVQFALEFAMQLFNDNKDVEDIEERETMTDLIEVWRKIIDIIFEYMYKTVKIVLLQFSASGVYANEIEKSESYENKNVPRDDTNGLRLEHNPDSGSDGSIDERINNLYSSSVGSQERLSVLKESYEEDLPESYNTKQYFRVQKEQDTTGQDKAKRNFQVAVIDYQEKKGLNDRPKKHKSSSDLRVTQGYYSNKKVAKADKHRNKHRPPSYESIEMMESDDSDSNKHEKATTRMLQSTKGRPTRPSKQKKAALKVEKDVFKPYSIAAQLECLRKKLSDFAIIEQEVVSKTVEYNDIVLWKIKEKPDDMDSATASFRASKKKVIPYDPPEKKIILIVHGLTVMGWHNLDCLNKIKRFETLVGYYMENLDCYDIFLIPMANPDGVTKSLNTQPWNKNMSPQNACPGVNLDRNFDVEWNSNASKESSCKQSYPGPEPFSERETKVVRDLLKTYSQRMVAYIHVHAGSYDSTVFKGDAVLYPRGYSDDTSDDDKYIDLKGDIDEAMRNTSLNVVSVAVETLYNWYGMTTGSSVDYASKVYGIPYAMELVMQLYEDDDQEVDEDKREQNAALVEIWQVVIDVIFDSIYKREIKPEEQ
ncbi:zinc carboxypeptidase domain-containing protein [Phthorimaea operculella]|nr:zinc carboxypeptidase domain-containing protein [Phthorimaea operculella]